MGSTSSKPSNAPIVLHGETPVRFSNTLVTTLTNSSETDSTREKQLELHIQSRVAEELARLSARESEVLATIDDRLQKGGDGDEKLLSLDRKKVQADVDTLRKRLEAMPKLDELEEGVAAARTNVVNCLRKNDTRPLDCWREVNEFKAQTRRMEKAFVIRTVGRQY